VTPAERLARAIARHNHVIFMQQRLHDFQRDLTTLRKDALKELQEARDEAQRRFNELPTNVQPEAVGTH
jgi:hypothetical protein